MESYKKGGSDRRQAGDRREYGNRSFRNNDRPGRSYGENNGRRSSDRPGRSYGDGERRSFGDGERRSFSSDRPRRSFGDNNERRPFGDRRRSFEERSSSDRPKRSYGDGERRSFGDGERRSFGSDRPRRSFGDNNERRPFGDRRRSFEERGSSDRPRRSYGDGERRSFGDGERRPFGDRKRSFGQDRRSFSGKNFNNRPARHFEDRAAEEGINRMISRKPLVEDNAFSDNDLINIPVKDTVRLNKFIANSGVCSRREADNFILAGVVTVNGEVVTELGTKVNITDDIRFNGERLKGEAKVYIVMNKPKGYVTTASDPHADKTVMDLLKGCEARVFPVGRLDKNTTGVLMFTNDGEMAEKLTHPSYDKKKIYQVTLDNKLSQEDFDKIVSGVTLSDGEIAADELEYIDADDHRKLGIEIHSGKNRIVRRIFESLGYEVKALDRVYFAGLTKKGIKRGNWRFLTEGEANILKMGAYN